MNAKKTPAKKVTKKTAPKRTTKKAAIKKSTKKAASKKAPAKKSTKKGAVNREDGAVIAGKIEKFMRKGKDYTTKEILLGIGYKDESKNYRKVRRALRGLVADKKLNNGNNEDIRGLVWVKK